MMFSPPPRRRRRRSNRSSSSSSSILLLSIVVVVVFLLLSLSLFLLSLPTLCLGQQQEQHYQHQQREQEQEQYPPVCNKNVVVVDGRIDDDCSSGTTTTTHNDHTNVAAVGDQESPQEFSSSTQQQQQEEEEEQQEKHIKGKRKGFVNRHNDDDLTRTTRTTSRLEQEDSEHYDVYDDDDDDVPPPPSSSSSSSCGLYLAESTIPNAGLGIFTAIEKHVGDIIGDDNEYLMSKSSSSSSSSSSSRSSGSSGSSGSSRGRSSTNDDEDILYGDVCIPVLNLYWNNGDEYIHPFMDYFWSGQSMGMTYETQTDDIEALCPGLDCAINCNLALINVEKATPQYMDSTNHHGTGSGGGALHRSMDPGVGGYSPYHNGTTIVKRYIPAGGELFKSYGEQWFETREETFGTQIPYEYDYEVAQELIVSMMELRIAQSSQQQQHQPQTNPNKKKNRKGNSSRRQQQQQQQQTNAERRRRIGDDDGGGDLLSNILKDLYEEVIINTINEQGSIFESRTLNALPKTIDELQQVMMNINNSNNNNKNYNIANIDDMIIPTTIHQPKAIRSIDWLQRHGTCIDHIVPKRSTIYQAGYGAFLKRSMKSGTVITASPLHHVVDGTEFMNMYEITKKYNDEMDELVKDSKGRQIWLRHLDDIRHSQLLLNYCYGHRSSTMLLCPYGSGINYINHNQTHANVRIRWAQTKETSIYDIVHQSWIVESGTIENDLSKTVKPMLAFEYVATRDIQAGEELFLDYGDEWEDAWNDHVENYYESLQAENSDNDNNDNGDYSKRYISARAFNEKFGDIILRTYDEQVYDPYPKHLHIRCHPALFHNHHQQQQQRQSPSGQQQQEQQPKIIRYVWELHDKGIACRITDRFIETITTTTTTPSSGYYYNQHYGQQQQYYYQQQQQQEHTFYTVVLEIPNEIVHRWDDDEDDDDEEEFADGFDGVTSEQQRRRRRRNIQEQLKPQKNDNSNKTEEEKTVAVTWIERTDVPRSAIRFFDIPGTTDIHLPYAFRHEIHIPDDMFPNQWKNMMN